jgi:uncharacterized protein YrrD
MNIMYRAKDFYMMEVKDVHGKKLGFIKDIDINFNEQCIAGFILSSYNIFKKEVKVLTEDIIIFNDIMIVKKITRKKSLELNSIKGMDVIDKDNNILGMVEEIIFEAIDFRIQGVIISSGIIKDFISGKRIFLLKNLILGDSNILCTYEDKKIEFFSRSHKIASEEDKYEKMV